MLPLIKEDKNCPKCGDEDFIGRYEYGKLIGYTCLKCDYNKRINEVYK